MVALGAIAAGLVVATIYVLTPPAVTEIGEDSGQL